MQNKQLTVNILWIACWFQPPAKCIWSFCCTHWKRNNKRSDKTQICKTVYINTLSLIGCIMKNYNTIFLTFWPSTLKYVKPIIISLRYVITNKTVLMWIKYQIHNLTIHPFLLVLPTRYQERPIDSLHWI